LDFYRTGALIVPATIPKKLLKKELQFWQLSVSTDGKPKKKDELEDLCRLILDHVSRSTASAEATRDLIISKKEQFKDGDDILVVSQYVPDSSLALMAHLAQIWVVFQAQKRQHLHRRLRMQDHRRP
jgi:hypothetical protein